MHRGVSRIDTLILVQEGNEVTGTYTNNIGLIAEGKIGGRIEERASGNSFFGGFEEYRVGRGISDEGTIRLVMSDDGMSFDAYRIEVGPNRDESRWASGTRLTEIVMHEESTPAPAPSTPTPTFTQPIEQPSPWAQTDVTTAINLGLVSPSLQSQYTQTITRAEFCALAVSLYEKEKGTITGRMNFTDTIDINVEKAAYIGVVTGIGYGKFDPNASLTREQAATMLARLANAIGNPIPANAPAFADNDSIAPWAFDAAGQMQASGIMQGVGYNEFVPQNPYTREQSITTILRLYNYVNN
jgi:hypothetical protein